MLIIDKPTIFTQYILIGYSGPNCDVLTSKLPDCNADVGINLAGVVDWSTEWPFIDIFKSSRDWISQNFISYTWSTETPQSIGSNGYPTKLLPNQKLGSMMLRDLKVLPHSNVHINPYIFIL